MKYIFWSIGVNTYIFLLLIILVGIGIAKSLFIFVTLLAYALIEVGFFIHRKERNRRKTIEDEWKKRKSEYFD